MKNYKKESNYLFKVLWSKTYVGIAINEIHNENCNLPLTTFYFWPREDGWKLLKADLDSKPWMNEQAKLEILNGYTFIINYWLKNVNQNINTLRPNTENINLNIEILGRNTIN